MNKKLLAAVCLAAAATLNTAWADDYTSGDGRYEEPNFDMNMTQEEAAAVKDDKDVTETKDGEEKDGESRPKDEDRFEIRRCGAFFSIGGCFLSDPGKAVSSAHREKRT